MSILDANRDIMVKGCGLVIQELLINGLVA